MKHEFWKLILMAVAVVALAGCGGGEDKTESGANTTINVDSGGGAVQICIIETKNGDLKAGAVNSLDACGKFGGIPLEEGSLGTIGLTEANNNPEVPFVENCSAASQANGVCQPIPSSEG